VCVCVCVCTSVIFERNDLLHGHSVCWFILTVFRSR